LLPKVKVVGF